MEDQRLKEVHCDDLVCGFMIRGRNETELIEALKSHAKTTHGLESSDDQIHLKIKHLE